MQAGYADIIKYTIALLLIIVVEITTTSIFTSIALHSELSLTVNGNLSLALSGILATIIFSFIPLIVTITLLLYRVPLRDVIDGSILMYALVTTMLLYSFKIWGDIVYVVGLAVLILGMYFGYIPLAIAGLAPMLLTVLLYNPLLVSVISLTPIGIWILLRRKVNFDVVSLFIASVVLLFYYSLDPSLVDFVRQGGVYVVILLWSILNKKFPNIFRFRENLKYSISEIKGNLYVWIITAYMISNSITAIKEGTLFRAIYEILIGIIFYGIYRDS